MLRAIIAIVGLSFCAGGAYQIALVPHQISGIPTLVIGVLILAGLFFEPRYRSRPQGARGPWEPTGEKFIDPATNKLVEVDYNPQTGEREYRDAE